MKVKKILSYRAKIMMRFDSQTRKQNISPNRFFLWSLVYPSHAKKILLKYQKWSHRARFNSMQAMKRTKCIWWVKDSKALTYNIQVSGRNEHCDFIHLSWFIRLFSTTIGSIHTSIFSNTLWTLNEPITRANGGRRWQVL